MSIKSVALGLAIAVALSVPAQAAGLLNGGFESGDLTGWTFSDGFVQVVTSADDATQDPIFGEHYLPTGGAYFAQLTAGVDVGVYSLLSQDFTLSGASTVSGDAAFLAFDSAPFNDDAYVRIFNADTNQIVFNSDVLTVGDFGHTDWTHFTSGVLGAGTYTLEAGVRNDPGPDGDDNSFSSQLLVDSFYISEIGGSGVPEPASWTMLIGGFGLAGASLRRRRAAVTA
jgi:hypothetical protein